MACQLDKAAIDLDRLRTDIREELLNLLNEIGGRQCLVVDADISGKLKHIFVGGARALRSHGVCFIRDLGQNTGNCVDEGIQVPPEHVVYLVRADVKSMFLIANHVKAALRCRELLDVPSPLPKFHVFMVPRTTLLCTQVLEDELVLPHMQVGAYHLDAVCLDVDVISLELERCFLDVKIHSDPTALECVAQALVRLEQLYGAPQQIWCLGAAARGVAERLARANLKSEHARLGDIGAKSGGVPRILGSTARCCPLAKMVDTLARADINTLVLIDRDVDLVTPMVTPLTYEGLVDEIMGGIQNAYVQLPRDVFGNDGDSPTAALPPEERRPFALNSNDALYAEIRDLNVERLGAHLGERAKAVRGSYDAFRSNKDASITEIHEFVKRIPGLTQVYRSLQTHINVTEHIKRTTDSRDFRDRWNTERALLEGETAYDQVEELIATQEPLMSLLRLLCLKSLTAGGVRAAKYDFIRREVLQTYGFELLGTIHNLEQVGLLTKARDGVASNLLGGGADTAPFTVLRRGLRLIVNDGVQSVPQMRLSLKVDEVNPLAPTDIAYVFSGYAPLSCRLIERLALDGAPGLASALPHLPGPPHLAYAPRNIDMAQLVDAFAPNRTSRLTIDASHIPARQQPLRQDGSKPVLVVCYIGGITYAEIAALRFLSHQPTFPFTILVATTAILNGASLIKGLVFEVDPPSDDGLRRSQHAYV